MLDQYTKDLVKELNIIPSSLSSTADGVQLEIAKSIKISLKELHPGLFLQAFIAPLPTKQRENILLHAMKANFLGQGTGGHVIGLDATEQFLILSHLISYDVNYLNFKELIEEFVNYLCFWQTEVERIQKTESGIF